MSDDAGRRRVGILDRLFGGGSVFSPQPNGPMGGTYRTVCVRTCDGYYFPISFETSPDHFREDEQTCQRMCPAAEVQLYTYHNPGEEMTQAVALNGRLYTELPAAFQYRKALSPACSCRRPGESWADALRVNGGEVLRLPVDPDAPIGEQGRPRTRMSGQERREQLIKVGEEGKAEMMPLKDPCRRGGARRPPGATRGRRRGPGSAVGTPPGRCRSRRDACPTA